MNLIVAVDGNWNIGYQGGLLCKNPIDMKFFKETTTGKVVIMGNKTLESFKNSKPLPNRTNIVLSFDKKEIDGCIVVNSVDELLEKIKDYKKEDLFVIGGGMTYRTLLPYCDTAYITKMKNTFEADTSFPNLDTDENWDLDEKSEDLNYEDIKFNFCTYKRR
jgi:dihydrofolate reductase